MYAATNQHVNNNGYLNRNNTAYGNKIIYYVVQNLILIGTYFPFGMMNDN